LANKERKRGLFDFWIYSECLVIVDSERANGATGLEEITINADAQKETKYVFREPTTS
jgi:hypothetical protein